MIERLALALVLAALGWLGYRSLNRLLLVRAWHRVLRLDDYRPGRPAIIYFTAPGCAPCVNVQAPALDRLSGAFGRRLQVLEIDVSVRPDLADAWGVLTVPTTFIVDARGRPRGVNHGVARFDRLLTQLAAVGERPPTPLEPSHAR